MRAYRICSVPDWLSVSCHKDYPCCSTTPAETIHPYCARGLDRQRSSDSWCELLSLCIKQLKLRPPFHVKPHKQSSLFQKICHVPCEPQWTHSLIPMHLVWELLLRTWHKGKVTQLCSNRYLQQATLLCLGASFRCDPRHFAFRL